MWIYVTKLQNYNASPYCDSFVILCKCEKVKTVAKISISNTNFGNVPMVVDVCCGNVPIIINNKIQFFIPPYDIFTRWAL